MVENLRNLSRGKIIYTFGMFGLGLCSTTVVQWMLFYYTNPAAPEATIYLGAAMVGMAVALGRLVDAWVDPVIGYYSDRTQLRFGRRKPFMAVSIPLFAVSFVLLWFPPSPVPSWLNLVWIAGLLSVFFISLSAYALPYLALLPELARNNEERVLLALIQSMVFAGGAGLATIAPPALSGIIGFPEIAFLWALIAVPTLALPLFTVQENRHRTAVPSTASAGEVLRSIRRNRALFTWALTLFFIWSGLSVIVQLMPFLFTFRELHLIALSWRMIVITVLLVLAGLFVGYRIASVYGMRVTYLSCLIAAGLLILLLSGIESLWLPGASQIKVWMLIILLLPVTVLPVALQNAVTAEIAIAHQQREGQHQEAFMFAVQGLAVKLALAMGALSLGLLLDFFGYELEEPAGVRAGYVLASLFLFTAAAFIGRYPNRLSLNHS